MRKFQQQQILDVIQSLHILHGEIKDRLNGKAYDTVQTALADCQEAAIQVGEAIEQMEGIGTQAVSCLEQYCENVYQTSIQMQEISAQKAYKSLEANLIRAENDIKHMPVKLEVVFLPYNVSMWDSLESIWKAADEDPNCDACVIPIPYYDKNPDGSYKKIIFYNTSINALLKHENEMLAKMQDVLATFKENRDDIALSDAYYGNGSSVVQLCQAAGKPVMIQSDDITKNY